MSHSTKKKKEPTAAIRELMSQPGIKKIKVFKSGDPYHQGVQIVVNDRQVHDLEILLTAITARIDLPFGAKKLYTTSGIQVKNMRNVKDGTDYVASSGAFVPMAYGESSGRSRAKSMEPAKKKKKKKRTQSVAPPTERISIEKEKEEKKKVVKKSKKIKKKPKEEEKGDEVVIPLNADLRKDEEEEEKDKEEKEEFRSVSRYAERPSTPRPESRMSSKSTHKEEENHSDQDSDGEKDEEKEGSEIEIPLNKEEDSEGHSKDNEKERREGESPKEVGKRRRRREDLQILGNSVEKKRKSVYHWGDLSSFTKNIESLLRRKE